MTKDLTEQWKNGELEQGYYYTKYNPKVGKPFVEIELKNYLIDLAKVRDAETVEVLAPVPSYEEWEIASEQLNKNGIWYTERSYKELKKEKRVLEVLVGNRDNAIQELRKENAKLKELLEQASYYLIGYKNNDTLPERAFYEEEVSEFLEKIDEVLK